MQAHDLTVSDTLFALLARSIVILQFLVFCVQLKPIGSRRQGTKEDFLELYCQCEAGFSEEIDEIKTTYGFKKWKTVLPSKKQNAKTS